MIFIIYSSYLVESEITLDGVGGEKDFAVARQDQQEPVECLQLSGF